MSVWGYQQIPAPDAPPPPPHTQWGAQFDLQPPVLVLCAATEHSQASERFGQSVTLFHSVFCFCYGGRQPRTAASATSGYHHEEALVLMVFGSQDAWRRHPVVSKGYRAAFPGLRNAVIIFGAYLVVDFLGNKLGGGGGGHGAQHGHADNIKPVVSVLVRQPSLLLLLLLFLPSSFPYRRDTRLRLTLFFSARHYYFPPLFRSGGRRRQ